MTEIPEELDDSAEPREVLQTMVDLMKAVEDENKDVKVDIHRSLLELAIEEIDKWKYLADEFARCIVIHAGEEKPRINLDIEKFLETQHNYQLAINDIQQSV